MALAIPHTYKVTNAGLLVGYQRLFRSTNRLRHREQNTGILWEASTLAAPTGAWGPAGNGFGTTNFPLIGGTDIPPSNFSLAVPGYSTTLLQAGSSLNFSADFSGTVTLEAYDVMSRLIGSTEVVGIGAEAQYELILNGNPDIYARDLGTTRPFSQTLSFIWGSELSNNGTNAVWAKFPYVEHANTVFTVTGGHRIALYDATGVMYANDAGHIGTLSFSPTQDMWVCVATAGTNFFGDFDNWDNTLESVLVGSATLTIAVEAPPDPEPFWTNLTGTIETI